MPNNRPINTPTSEQQMLAAFKKGVEFPPLLLRSKQTNRGQTGEPAARAEGRFHPDALIGATWNNDSYEFCAEFKSRSTPQQFDLAVRNVQAYPSSTVQFPMVVLPYLRPNQLDQLLQLQISGVDLSGNGVIVIPGRLLVYRTGSQNSYRDSVPKKFVYRDTTSLVARVFLCRTTYDSLADIESEIKQRGGSVSLSTISKALARMEEDVVIAKRPGRIELIQPDILLDHLAASFREPKVHRTITCALARPIDRVLHDTKHKLALALSGKSSTSAYAVMGRESAIALYCKDIDAALSAWGSDAKEDARFPDITLQETSDPTPFFDVRPMNGMPFSSPIQTYLELSTGDKREKETADQVRQRILQDLHSKTN